MLSGNEIFEQIQNGNIVIDPFNKEQLNPNSYNLTLGEELIVYTEDVLDIKKDNAYKILKIPKEGYTLVPGEIYVAKTIEYTETRGFVPQISGRSSIGRVGLSVHITAGLGGNGYKGNWTLSLNCTRPLKIMAGMQLCQIYFYKIIGEETKFYNGKYTNKGELFASKSFKEFENKKS